jgi:hypothetical protein
MHRWRPLGTARIRWHVDQTWTSAGWVPRLRPRLVTAASGAPVRRDQTPIARPGMEGRSLPVETTRLESSLGPSGPVWTGASARTILRSMTTPTQRCPTCGGLLATDKHSLLPPDERLTPWMIHDLPRIA